MNAVWTPLTTQLDRWRAAGRCPQFWLRDDDAVVPTPALEQLLALSNRFETPITLAVIPARTGPELARRLSLEKRIAVAVHGWSHANHAPPSEKKQELGRHRPVERVTAELANSLQTITRLFAEQSVPMLVPPWNRIDPDVTAMLPAIGYRAISTFGPAKPAPLAVLNTTVDIMDWHGTRGCREHGMLVDEIAKQLEKSFENGKPIGMLTHHLVHDAAAWLFLERLFEISRDHGSAWLSVPALLSAGQKV